MEVNEMADKKKPVATKKPNYVKVPKENMSRWDIGGAGITPPTKKYEPKKGK